MIGVVVDTLAGLAQAGMTPRQIAVVLRLVAAERRENQRICDRVELVWPQPEVAGSASRDAGAVVRDLFRTARRSVLISNYAVDRPTTAEAHERARALLVPLAENLDRAPALRVWMFGNMARPHPSQPGASKLDAVLLREVAEGFLGLLHNPFVARSLREQFESLIQEGALMRLPGVG